MNKRASTEGIHTRLAQNIRHLRRKKGWSQEKLALEADIHRVFMGRIERCEQSPSISTVEKIAKALDTPIQDLF